MSLLFNVSNIEAQFSCSTRNIHANCLAMPEQPKKSLDFVCSSLTNCIRRYQMVWAS